MFIRLKQIEDNVFRPIKRRNCLTPKSVAVTPAGGPQVVDDVYDLESQLVQLYFNNKKIRVNGKGIGYIISNSVLIAGYKVRAVQFYNIK